jgi:predicted metalloprotease
MRWREGRRSTHVQDRRGAGRPMLIGGGIGGLLLMAVAFLLGGDPSSLIGGGSSGPPDPAQDEAADFTSVVLADTEDVWNAQFQQRGLDYREPELVIFRDAVQSGCGYGTAEVGPFYCPADQHVYLDLAFFDELERRFEAPGDFARAYVIAHEVGHHVQTQLGISRSVVAESRGLSEEDANELSVRQELQADCFAGVWAHHAQRSRNILEEGDLEEALGAASAIGDDTLQRRSGGRVVPDSFTHGTSAQRARWFRRGLESGSVEQCNTFAISQL